MSVEIIIDLATKDGSVATETVKVDDILWISGKTNRAGCNVVMRAGVKLKSINEPMVLRARIDEARANDTEPQKG